MRTYRSPHGNGGPVRHAPAGFTLVEALVVIGIIGTLMAILLPTVRGVRDRAAAVKCQSQLRELYVAQLAFASDNRGRFTPISNSGNRWEQLLGPYVSKSGRLPRDLMQCPRSIKAQQSGLAAVNYSSFALNPALQMNNWKFRRDAKMDASRIILMGDKSDHQADDFLTTYDGYFMIDDGATGQWWRYTAHNGARGLRHGGRDARANMVMADGSVRSMDRGELMRDSGHWYWGGIDYMPSYSAGAGCCP